MVANQIAKTRYMTDGQVSLPLVLRTANGAGLRFGAQHSQSVENWAMAIPGLKVVAPSTPADMVGLMAAAIRDPDPVIFCEHKALFADKGEVPDGEHRRHARDGARRPRRDATPRSWPWPRWSPRRSRPPTGWRPSTASDAEVIDLRSLVPLDTAAILASVAKTSRLFTVEENPRLCGWGAEIASIVADEGFYSLDAPIVRITTPHIPLPSAAALEDLAVPSVERIVETVRRRMDAAPRRRRPTAVAVLGTGRMGSAMAERLAADGRRGRGLQPDAGARRRRWPRGSAARVAATPAEAARAADVVISMVADDAAVARRCTTARTASPPACGPGAVAVDMSTVLPATIRSIAPAVRDRGAGILDAPVSGSVSSDPRRASSTIMVGGEAGGPRARPAGPRLRSRDASSISAPLGTGAAMKLAVNTVIFGLNEARRRGAGPGRAQRHRPGARLRRPGGERRRARRSSATSGRRSSNPDATPVAFSLDLAAKDLRLIAEPGRGVRQCDAAGGRQPRHDPGGRAVGRESDADFSHGRESPASGGPAMTDRP